MKRFYNLSQMSTQPSKVYRVVVFLKPLILVAFACSFLIACQRWGIENNSLQATLEVERTLTDAHQTEVVNTIEGFELKWHSLEAHMDSAIPAELATQSYIKHSDILRDPEDLLGEPYWIIIKSVMVENVRVIEFNLSSFKAIACVKSTNERVTPEGTLIELLPPTTQCGVYVFHRENSNWKLAGYFNTTMPDSVEQDWEHTPAWLKEVIGELPRDPSLLNDR